MRKSIISLFLASALLGTSVSSFATEQTTAAQPVSGAQASTVLNLNTADAEALSKGLIGIGAAKAQAIVDYREAHGPFTSVDQLLEVKGIGVSILEKNRERIGL